MGPEDAKKAERQRNHRRTMIHHGAAAAFATAAAAVAAAANAATASVATAADILSSCFRP